MPKLADLKTKIFADGAAKADMVELAKNNWVAGFTTNPSLLKKAGVKDYAAFAQDVVRAIPDRHISFEVFSDDIPEMIEQARIITTWGKNVYVKLPVINTRGEPLYDAVHRLSGEGVNINVTAVFTKEQVERSIKALDGLAPAVVSVWDTINEPRYPSFKGIMAAKKKPVQTLSLADLGVEASEVGFDGATSEVVESSRVQ